MNIRPNPRYLLALLACLAALPAGVRAQDAPADAVVRTGILKVAVYKDNFPFSDVKDGGIDVDIAQALAERLGVKLSLLPFDAGENQNDDLRNMVWKGHYLGYGPADVMLHVPYDPVLGRQNENVALIAPYHVESLALAIDTKRIPDWQGFEVFRQEKIAVDGGSYSAQVVLGMDGGSYLDHVVISRSFAAAVQQLRSGAVAAVLGMRSELEAAGVSKMPYQLVGINTAGAPRRSWAVGLAVKRDRKELASRLSAAVKDLEADGSMARIFERHGVRYVQP